MTQPPASRTASSALSWHRRLYEASYTNFGVAAPANPDAAHYLVNVVLALVYLALGTAVFLLLNAATVPFGVFVDPVWRSEARFRLLRLPNGLPLLVPCCIVLGGYAAWRHVLAHGFGLTIGGVLLTFALGVASFAAVIAANTLLANRRAG